MQGNVFFQRDTASPFAECRITSASASQRLKCVSINIKVFRFWNIQISGYNYFTSSHMDHQYNTFSQQNTIQTHCRAAVDWIKWTTKKKWNKIRH